ncbi:hypothetical protein Taro_002559 [Colocasia esculenta]|uniref:Pentatricopeptide repeat-containing protein n=1 Tax=Colocasia esculenta TaxID=4460 RepID=A0A843TGX3_COLES|nr:hypothetical protein [Colocasia esculenta]
MQTLLKHGFSPTPQSVNLLLSSLLRAGRYHLLLHVFSQISSNSVPTDSRTQTLAARAFLKSGQFQEAEDLILRGESSHLFCKKGLWDALIRGVCTVGEDPEKGFALLLECVGSLGRRPSVRTFRSLVFSFCSRGEMRSALEVVETMTSQKVGYLLDNHVCSSIICGFYRVGKPDLALVFLENAWKDDNCFIYNDVIVLLCNHNYCEIAMELYMLARRKGIVVTDKSYYALLKILFRSGDMHLISLIMSTYLKQYGLGEPRVINILSLLLCKKDVDKALQFPSQMEKKNIYSSASTAIVDSLKRVGRIEDAYKFVMEAERSGVALDVVTYSIVIDGLCKEGYLEKALMLCTEMRNRGVQPNIVTYNSVIFGLCQQGCLVEAFRIFDSLQQNNLTPTVITYAILIHALCIEGYLSDAKQLFKKMIQSDVVPNTRVYGLLINGYCSFGLLKEAMELLMQLEENSLLPDAFTISSVVYGFCILGDMEGALGFYTEYKEKGITLDFLGFFFLIEGLCAKGRLEEARTILQDMLQCQLVTDIINKSSSEIQEASLVSLLGFLCEQGRIKDAVRVLSEVRSFAITSGIITSSHRCTALERLYRVETLGTGNKVENSDREGSCSSVLETLKKTDDKTELNYSMWKTGDSSIRLQIGGGKDSRLNDIEYLIGSSRFHDFDIYYPIIALLCSEGELQKASSALKLVLMNSGKSS